MCVLWGGNHFPVYILRQVSLFRLFHWRLSPFCLIQRATPPYTAKSPCRHLTAASPFGKAWQLFLLELPQLSSVLIIEKIWKREDLILVQAFYTCSHIFTWKRCRISPGMDIDEFAPARSNAYVELTFEGTEPFILFGAFMFRLPSVGGVVVKVHFQAYEIILSPRILLCEFSTVCKYVIYKCYHSTNVIFVVSP